DLGLPYTPSLALAPVQPTGFSTGFWPGSTCGAGAIVGRWILPVTAYPWRGRTSVPGRSRPSPSARPPVWPNARCPPPSQSSAPCFAPAGFARAALRTRRARPAGAAGVDRVAAPASEHHVDDALALAVRKPGVALGSRGGVALARYALDTLPLV